MEFYLWNIPFLIANIKGSCLKFVSIEEYLHELKKQITVKPGFQKIVKSGVFCNFSEKTHAYVEAPLKKSTIEP